MTPAEPQPRVQKGSEAAKSAQRRTIAGREASMALLYQPITIPAAARRAPVLLPSPLPWRLSSRSSATTTSFRWPSSSCSDFRALR